MVRVAALCELPGVAQGQGVLGEEVGIEVGDAHHAVEIDFQFRRLPEGALERMETR